MVFWVKCNYSFKGILLPYWDFKGGNGDFMGQNGDLMGFIGGFIGILWGFHVIHGDLMKIFH